MSLSEQFSIGARIKGKTAVATVFTQTSTAAPTAVDGLTVDRNLSPLRRYYSCKVVIGGQFLYAASSAHTVSIAGFTVQHSSDGTSWDSYTTNASTVTWGTTAAAASLTTAGTEADELEHNVNLNGARRYIRVQLPAPTFSDCSSGAVLTVGGAFVFGGADELPAQ